MKAIEKIMAKDSGELLRKRIAELDAEKSHLKTSTTESAETIDTLQHSGDSGIEDYNLL
jgi:chromosome segregation ATPase